MSGLTTLTQVNGSDVNVSWFDVAAIREDSIDATKCYVYDLHQSPNTDPWHIDATAAATAALLSAASGLTAVALSPFATLATMDGDDLYVAGRNVPSVRADPDNALACYLFISAQVKAFYISGALAATVALINAADPAAAAGTGPGAVIAGGIIAANGGAITQSFGGLALRAAYVAGTGDFQLSFSLATTNVIVLIQQLGAAAAQSVFAYEIPAGGQINVHADPIPAGAWPDTIQIAVTVIRTA